MSEEEREGEGGREQSAGTKPPASGENQGKPKKPLPPLPESEDGKQKLNGEEDEGPGGERGEEGVEGEEDKGRHSPPALGRPLSLPLDSSAKPKKGESDGTSTLQRYTKSAMKEKAERWRERRNEEGTHDTSSPEATRPQNLRIKGLQ